MKQKPVTTKKKILDTAISMLNELGLSNVKLRDVSQALHISIGNLTYHYPKWENLMDDIFGQFQGDINQLYDFFPKDISEVVTYIERIYEIQLKYAFLFSNFYIFFQQYPKYKATEEDFFINRMKIMREALEKLVE